MDVSTAVEGFPQNTLDSRSEVVYNLQTRNQSTFQKYKMIITQGTIILLPSNFIFVWQKYQILILTSFRPLKGPMAETVFPCTMT